MANLYEIMDDIRSENILIQIMYTRRARKMTLTNKPIHVIIKSDIVNQLIKFLRMDKLTEHQEKSGWGLDKLAELQKEAAWTLVKLTFGTSEHTGIVVDAGAVPLLIWLLDSRKLSMRLDAVIGLANISADGPILRDYVINSGIIDPLLRLLNRTASLIIIREASSMIANLCYAGNTPPPFNLVRRFLFKLSTLIVYDDETVVTNACEALSYLTEGEENDKIKIIVSFGVVPHLVDILKRQLPQTAIVFALGAIRNILNGSHNPDVFDIGVLSAFPGLLLHDKLVVRCEATWTMVNIAAGNMVQMQAVINAGILPLIKTILEKAGVDKIYKRCQAADTPMAIFSLTSSGCQQQVGDEVTGGLLNYLCRMLDGQPPNILITVLFCIETVLGKVKNNLALGDAHFIIEPCEAKEKIRQLRVNENENVRWSAARITEEYF